jgi:drug/metabolite transporter (DMT)-like permease
MQSLWMLAAGLLFSLMGVLIKLAAPHFATAELVFYRSLVQMVVSFAVLRHAGLSARTPCFGRHVHRGIAGFVSLFMFFYALTELSVATAMTLNYTSPLFLAVLLAGLHRERPGTKLTATVVLGFVGALLVLQPALHADQLWAGLIGLASGATSAVAYWNVRELVQAKEPEGRVVFYFSVFALLGSLVWMVPQPWHPVTADTAWLLIGIGATGTLGQLAMTRAYGQGRTLVTAALSYSGIVFSSVIGIAFLGDAVGWASWLGMALIVAAGILAVQLRPGGRRDSLPVATND